MEIKIIDRLISKNASWDDLYKELSTYSKFTQKFKGDVFERLTQAYLLTMPEYHSILSNVWLNQEVPRNVLKKLNLPAEDFGVDLIAKTKRNEYWTIQCKFKSTDSALTYKELSTFSTLSFVNAKNISLGIVSHSSNKPIRNRNFLGNISEISLDRWLNLTDDEWKNIRKFCQHKSIKLVKRKPRAHQRKAINLSKKYFVQEKNSKGKLIMPCATGKSLTAFWITQSIDAKKIIVAVPSLNLVKQSLNDWTKEYLAHGITPEWLCICSDESAGKVDIDEFNTDTYDLGIPTTTNKKEITSFLKRKSKNPKIIFTTYQSSPRLAESARSEKSSFDFAILDEAHKTVGMKSKSFSTLLFDKKIKIKKRLFMTATERILRGSKDEVVSMNNTKVYGEDIYVMTFKDAIDQDIISDYKILTIAVSDNETDALIEDNRYITKDNSDNESSAQYFAAGIALKKTFKKYKIKHAISFHRSIKLAKVFQEQQDELNKIKYLRPIVQNLHISSKKTAGQRIELIKEFIEHKRSLLTNARCLTEGVDVPAIDCVMFVDPKQSVTDIVQAAGRALRKFDGKDFGYILLPIVVPSHMGLEEFSESSSFKKITSIIAALSSQDERIYEELKLSHVDKKSSGKIINIDSKIKLSKKIHIEKFIKNIETKIWEKVGKINLREFKEARNYARSLNLYSQTTWKQHVKQKNLPADIPATPQQVYKNSGWISWGDWLGTNRLANKDISFKDFKEARRYVRRLNLKSEHELREYYKVNTRPKDIPSNPGKTYKDNGWISMGDWLGTGRIATQKIEYLSYKQVKKYVIEKKITTQKQWNKNKLNLPKNIPSNPNQTYANEGWVSWGDFLATGFVSFNLRKYLPFKDARLYARSLGFSSVKEWKKHVKTKSFPKNIPMIPRQSYKDSGFIDMADWLGSDIVKGGKDRKFQYLSFVDARKFSRDLNLKSQEEWFSWKKNSKRKDIPYSPYREYKDNGWVSWGDWLGTGRVADQLKEFKQFKDARIFARDLNLKSLKEWQHFCKTKDLPDDIPKTPHHVYKNEGWIGYKDWLGN